ncbi:hypothetical protein IFR05_004862 [Cadophora sp. M221]|nr:hypothetical protein IFR05_004862 [Cadophora sp. M221]
MAYNNYQQLPFWDFFRAFDQNGAGVDHAQPGEPFGHGPQPGQASGSHPPPPPPPGAFPWGGPHGPFEFPGGFGHPFGGPGFHGRGGRQGRHCRRDHSGERSRSRTASPSGEHTEGEGPDGPAGHRGPRGHGRHGRHEHPEGEAGEVHEGHHRGPRGFGGRGRGGHRGGWGHHGRRGPPPFGGPGGMAGFDLSGLFDALNSHPLGQQPWAQMLRQYAQQAGLAGAGQRSGETLIPDDENTFTPPIDVFSTETAYILHIALPGAKKEDVGVNYDSDKGELNVAGVVYRQGDEDFLKSLSQSERKVGVFERTIKLPPANEEKEEVDGDGITAKLEDGVLVVTVPKVEKEWTEVKRIDIN